jgi:hypothetical protein
LWWGRPHESEPTEGRIPAHAKSLKTLYIFLTIISAQAYFVVGTAVALPHESEPTEGRILLFEVVDRRLRLVTEKVRARVCGGADIVD